MGGSQSDQNDSDATLSTKRKSPKKKATTPPKTQTKPDEQLTDNTAENSNSGNGSMSQISDNFTPIQVENPEYDPANVFVDKDKGKPLFQKAKPPAGVLRTLTGNGPLKNPGDQDGDAGEFTRENDMEQVSLTNEDYF